VVRRRRVSETVVAEASCDALMMAIVREPSCGVGISSEPACDGKQE
jgi:hypothetical protein